MIRKAIIVVLTLDAIGIGWLCVFPLKQPRIIFAWGYGDMHLFEPLNNKAGGFLSLLLDADRSNCNWDGRWLFVDGLCGVCGKPYAPRGSFVIAALPKGLAYCKHDGSPKYEHMTAPSYFSRLTLAEVSLVLSAYPTIAFVRGPLRCWRRRRHGLCLKCGYNLTGNLSGVCPECGTKVDRP